MTSISAPTTSDMQAWRTEEILPESRATWVPHDVRDTIVDFVRSWPEKTEIALSRSIAWLRIAPSKYYDWKKRYGKVNEHNAWIPRDFWVEDWEKQAIVDFYIEHSTDGYRRVAFMMLDADIVTVSGSGAKRSLSCMPHHIGMGFCQYSRTVMHAIGLSIGGARWQQRGMREIITQPV